jgi:hypothetical protein
MSHLLTYLGYEIEKEPPPPPVIPRPHIVRGCKLQIEFTKWYRSQGNSWGPLKRAFEGEAVTPTCDEGKRLAAILAVCTTEQRKKLRGYVRAAVGGVIGS